MEDQPMRFTITTVTGVASLLALTAPAGSQAMDHAMSGTSDLPEACRSEQALPSMQNMEGMMSGIGGPQQEMMQGMMAQQSPMIEGMTASDADVAFACGMIPHHRAAISMAEVELKSGDDEQMKVMAQKIIDAQKQEISELEKWIEEHAEKKYSPCRSARALAED
jgi:uncharacterized protein (DUF305 family)